MDEESPTMARLRVLAWVAFFGWMVAMALQCVYSSAKVSL